MAIDDACDDTQGLRTLLGFGCRAIARLKPRGGTLGVKILRGFAVVWMIVALLVNLLAVVGALLAAQSPLAGWQQVSEWYSPFNVWNYVAEVILLSPALIAFALAQRFENRRLTQRRGSLHRAAWFAATAGLLAPIPASAQQKLEVEILSKDDARQVFAMSRAQWTQNVQSAVAAGKARALGRADEGLRMAMETPDGDILMVQPDYFRGDVKPAVIHVTVGYRPPRAHLFTEQNIGDVVAAAHRQMAPEFEVVGRHERLEQGLMFFFSIMERRQ